MHEVNIPQVGLDLLINSVKWSERRGTQGEPNRGKKALKVFPVFGVTGRKKDSSSCQSCLLLKDKLVPFFSDCILWPFLILPPLFLFLCECWLRTLLLHWVRGRTQDLYTIFGLWWLMLLDTVSSIRPSHIILVMQKSSGPGIAWGLWSGNPNNFNSLSSCRRMQKWTNGWSCYFASVDYAMISGLVPCKNTELQE